MATIIDALVMTLGLDSSGFQKGAKDAVDTSKKTADELDKQAKQIEASQKKALDAFGKVADAALRFFGILTAGRGVVDFTRDSIEGAAALERLAENTGTSASTLSAWGRAAEVAGGSQDGFNNTVVTLSRMFTDLRTKGTSELVPFFNVLGVHLVDAHGKARDFTQILLDTSRAVQGMSRQDAFNLLTGAGHMDAGTANLIIKGPDAVQAMVTAQLRQGAVTDEQAKRAEALRQQWVQVGQTLDSIGQRLVAAVTPALMSVWHVLQDIAQWFSDHQDVAQAVFIGLAVAVAAAAVPLLAILAPLAGIAAGLAAITLGVAAVKLAFDKWLASSPAMAKAWSNLWTGAAEAVKAVWALLVAVFTGNSVDITNAWGRAATAFKSLFGDAFAYVKTLWHDLISGIESFFSGSGIVAKWLRGRIAAITGTDGATSANPAPAPAPAPSAPSGGTADLFAANEARYALPEGLQDAQWAQESGRGAHMLSPAGAQGHFGFMPATAREYGVDPNSLQSSADGAARKMHKLIMYYGGNVAKALAAYNWGEGNLNRDIAAHGDNWLSFAPRETQGYVRDIGGRIGLATPRAAAGGNVTNTTTVSVGEIRVVSTSADPRAVAQETRRAIIAQSDTGMR